MYLACRGRRGFLQAKRRAISEKKDNHTTFIKFINNKILMFLEVLPSLPGGPGWPGLPKNLKKIM